MTQKIPFYRHDLGQPELDAIAQVFSGDILTTGDNVTEFEMKFSSYLGRRNSLGVTSCTGALHMALLALGIGPGDEVITTPLTFVATSSAIMEAGAKPVFVDVEPDTGNLDATLVEKAITSRTKAILPVHLFGLMCDMKALKLIADQNNLAIIEDCAHCVEGIRDNIRPGEFSDAACFSFYATKNLTCGEGGAIVTESDELYKKLRLIRLHGMNKTAADRHKEGYNHWDMVTLGWKYNMDNIQAAILIPQLERIDKKLALREQIAQKYNNIFANSSNIKILSTRPNATHARHLYPIRVHASHRDRLIKELYQSGIQTVVNYRAIHLLTYFVKTLGHKEGDFPYAENIGSEVLSLPFYPTMPIQYVEQTAEAVQQILSNL